MENRLTQVKDSVGNSLASFTYDKDGKRSSLTTVSGMIFFHYSGDKVIYETDAANNVVASYTWDAQGNPVSMTKSGATYYYHINGHGDVTALTDASGTTVAQYAYDAWGNIITSSGTMKDANPYRYAGYRYDDATGLYYLMARYYDSITGRFLNNDDVTYSSRYTPITQNLYLYVQNNPVNYIDTTGHWGAKLVTKTALRGLIYELRTGTIINKLTGFLSYYQRQKLYKGRLMIADRLEPLLGAYEVFDEMIQAEIIYVLVNYVGVTTTTARYIAYGVSWLI